MKADGLSNDMKAGMIIGPFVVLATGLGISLIVALNATSIWFLWGWFIVPLGVPAVSFAHAAGLSLILACFHPIRSPNEGPKGVDMWTGFAMRPIFLITFGWIIKTVFM